MPDGAPPLIDSVAAARALFAPDLAGAPVERLCVAHLDADRRLLGLQRCAAGSAGQVELPVRAIVAEALRLGAHGLILGHNHPGGDPDPTPADIEATRALVRAVTPLGLRVHDHLIFAAGHCRSLRALRLV